MTEARFGPKRPVEPPGPGAYLQIPASEPDARREVVFAAIPSLAKEPLPFLAGRGNRVCIAAITAGSRYRVMAEAADVADVIRVEGLSLDHVQWLSCDLHELPPMLSIFDGPIVERAHRARLDLFIDDVDFARSWQYWCEDGMIVAVSPLVTMLVHRVPTTDIVLLAINVKPALFDGVLLPSFLQSAVFPADAGAEAVMAATLAALDYYDDMAIQRVRGRLTGLEALDRGPLALALAASEWSEPGAEFLEALGAAILPKP